MGAGRAEVAPEGPTSVCPAPWVRGPRDSLVPACRCQSVTGLDFGGSSADVKVQSAERLRRSGRLAEHLVGAWVEVRKTPGNSILAVLSYDNNGFFPKFPVLIGTIYHFLINLVTVP